MTLNYDNRDELVKLYMEKSERCRRDAEEFIETKPYMSVRMSYECAYFAVAALFVLNGLKVPPTHRGINSVLYQSFVEPGLLSRDTGKCIGKLETDRNLAQYDPFEEIPSSKARDDLEMAMSFQQDIKILLVKKT